MRLVGLSLCSRLPALPWSCPILFVHHSQVNVLSGTTQPWFLPGFYGGFQVSTSRVQQLYPYFQLPAEKLQPRQTCPVLSAAACFAGAVLCLVVYRPLHAVVWDFVQRQELLPVRATAQTSRHCANGAWMIIRNKKKRTFANVGMRCGVCFAEDSHTCRQSCMAVLSFLLQGKMDYFSGAAGDQKLLAVVFYLVRIRTCWLDVQKSNEKQGRNFTVVEAVQ